MIKTLTELLELQASQVEQLLALLADEKSALESRDLASLEKISNEKHTSVSQIAELDVKISQHSAVAELATVHQVHKEEIEAQLKQCQELNDVNGKLIELNLRNSKRLADTIIRSRSRNNITYDKLGRTRGTISSLGMKYTS